ncbi:MAG: polyhydroxyalkanoate synthesis repressor PhaR [Erythrobacter sp.]|uniref:polyhydroxyalkanoate synthesis repressor PhaR n=1 Tax=Erythrobacter sp. HL-111 TaxID=1798193 RepID=UPI0006DA92AF|nr:polyhydroxyalkanoate synthesis repressor PhaR [Erythrobacter sp. HL-111]KPP88756.1 MAG: polyhydroxyalkanoate synthesis repressor PhaR [Erythrobacteraceae bacterium HL-111]SDR95269.1 polyhydroxyalkanoate synthesis repressor PhaR [Erythrobacter sp. HL-111]
MGRKTNETVADGGEAIIIKKYANRRLYNTSSSSYITLDDLAAMVRENIEFEVLDAKTGDDITHSILTQIIMDEEANGGQMLPVSFLRELIGMYGHSMQAMMPSYLEASMENFRQNQTKIREAFEKGLTTGPLAAIHETNMAMMRAATGAFMPGAKPAPEKTVRRSDNGASASKEEIAALREQMAAMQKKLDELGK